MEKKLIEIRKARNEDARDWYLLLNKVWKDTYNDIFPEEVFIERDKMLDLNVENFSNKIKNDSENIAYVALCDGKIVGLMRGSIMSKYEYFCKDYADLIALYIDLEYQGLGIASSFKILFENWAKDNGASKYVIGVLKDNIKARKVYERWEGKLSLYKGKFVVLGQGYDEVFYTYDLDIMRN